jgi:lactoylglutathione lyase
MDRDRTVDAAMQETSNGAHAGYRLLHAMIRVRDLERSIDFYTRLFGMKLLRRTDYPTGKFTNVFVGYGHEDSHTVIELTHNWGREEPYEHGGAFGHLAVAVPDVYRACERLGTAGVKITRPAKFGSTVIAFVEDPDGYKIELIQRS